MIEFAHPLVMQICGPSMCGKTTFIINLLKRLDNFKKILWYNAEQNAIPQEIFKIRNIEVLNFAPTSFEHVENDTLIVLDDLMLDVYNKNVCELFTKGAHHRKISVILVTQNVFHQGRYARDISLNCKYLVLFKNPRDKAQIFHLARQIYPENPLELVKVYKEVTNKPHGYLLFDLTQSANELLRFSTDIFNIDYNYFYCSQLLLNDEKNCKKNETLEGVQTYLACAKAV